LTEESIAAAPGGRCIVRADSGWSASEWPIVSEKLV